MHDSPIRSLAIGLAAAGALAVSATGAAAAPQALALVATLGEVPLSCESGVCKAEFSAFCLQPDRYTPMKGTRYHMVQGGDLKLLGKRADGEDVVLAAAENLDFLTKRTHVALEISIPRSRLAKLGVESVRIAVGKNVSLMPEARPNDPNPMTEADLALAGQLRTLGAKIIDRNPDHMVAARITSRMINALPALGRVSTAENDVVWKQALGAAGGNEISPLARKLARQAVEFCDFAVERKARHGGMRRCLQKEHDDMLDILNSGYWNAVKTGS